LTKKQTKRIPVRQIAATHKEQNNAGRFSIRDIQQVLNGRCLVHDLHKHDFYFILALQKGTGIHEIDFIKYELQDNCFFILRPGQVHRLEMNEDCSGYIIEFEPSFYQARNTITEQRWRKATNKNYCETGEKHFLKLLSFLTNIFNEYSAKQEGYIEAIMASFDLFFIEIVRQSQNPDNLSKSVNNYTQERFEELMRLLETNICKMKSVSQYATLLNLSAYQLNAITKASVNKTTADLINDQIILEAKRHLLATSNQVKDIAWDLGYEDVSYFIRFFKKHTGHTPDTFRKNFK
jgi:AraC-like DNA-binding protein/mannose-6-phosphate isomerase-like protein (cupin superfamily)